MRQFFLAFLSGFMLISSFSSASYANGPKVWFENSGGFISRDRLTNGKTSIKSGMFGGYHLKELLKDNPTALELAEKHSKFNTYSHLSYWLGVIPSAVVTGVGAANSNVTTYLIGIGALVGTTVLTAHFVSESRHYLYEAVNTYNGVIKPSEGSLSEAPGSITSPFQNLKFSGDSILKLSFNF